MIDKLRMERKSTDAERYLGRLVGITPPTIGKYKSAGETVKAASERYLQLLSDIEMDMLAILYRSLDERVYGDESSLIDAMEARLGKDITAHVRELRELRNKLVHAYSDRNYDEEVYRMAKSAGTVEKLIKAVKGEIKQ